MKYLKGLFVGSLIFSLVLFLVPEDALAQCTFPGCFGGKNRAGFIYCTCSGYYWMGFAPLYLYPNPAPIAGFLAVPPAVSFPNYAPKPGDDLLGTYVPGVQMCWMYAVYGCYTLPTYGMVLPFTANSLGPTQ